MPRTSFAEFLLAPIAGRKRAAAIMGDLTEIASVRGRLWFFAAYARTVISLTWRIVLALFIADVAREMIFNLADFYFRATPESWRNNDGRQLLNSGGPLMACVMSTLWFVLPFAAVRFGVRDRFVRLTFAIACCTTVAFLFIPWISTSFAVAAVALAAVAAISPRWRRPLQVLLGTAAAGLATFLAAAALRGVLSSTGTAGKIAINGTGMLGFQLSLLAIAVAGSRLHRRLLKKELGSD